MASLATIVQLEARLGRDIPNGTETTQAQALLDDASAAVRGYTGQSFDEDETTERIWPRDGRIRLSQRPVIEVSAVKNVDGNDISFTWYEGDSVVVGATPLNYFEVNGIGTQPVDVTYEHGYATVPEDIVAVVCQIAGRALTRPADEAGLTQESIAGYSYSLGAAAGAGPLGMLADEKAVLDRYRKPIGTIRLRS